ncbi:MAG: hypothetical protein IPG11_13025 [Flavobacteriales bacterium]|nr:hypothetical protein [Flavobacteriales bacterium]
MLKEYHQSTSFNFFFDLIFFNGSTDVTPFDEVSGAPNTETFQEILFATGHSKYTARRA